MVYKKFIKRGGKTYCQKYQDGVRVSSTYPVGGANGSCYLVGWFVASTGVNQHPGLQLKQREEGTAVAVRV